MKRRFLLSLAFAGAAGLASAQTPLRVLTHDSFDLPAPLLAQFEQDAGVKLQLVKGGDAGEMLNRLVLTRANPIADVVFGIDNALLPRALQAGVIDAYTGPAANRSTDRASGTAVARRFTASDWRRDGEYLSMTYSIPSVDGPMYLRVRGTSTAELEPLADPKGEDPWSDLWFYANPIFVTVK